MSENSQLSIRGLRKEYQLRAGFLSQLAGRKGDVVTAVDDVDLELKPGEVLGLVGESGSGKTTVGKLVTRLEQPTRGEIRFEGRDISGLAGEQLKAFRRSVQMIFQNPYESLDPRMSIGDSVMEPLHLHGIGSAAERRSRAEGVLRQVELRPTGNFLERFPQELSGGQRQRISIARALVLSPKLIVADEPVSMLDVSVRSGIMNLMLDLRERLDVSYIFITHDLAVARYMAHRLAVMYLGRIVETGPTEEVVRGAGHPYTRLLMAAVPQHRTGPRRERIRLSGEAAAIKAIPAGCRFHPRCPLAQPVCAEKEPAPVQVGPAQWAACHFAADVFGMEGIRAARG